MGVLIADHQAVEAKGELQAPNQGACQQSEVWAGQPAQRIVMGMPPAIDLLPHELLGDRAAIRVCVGRAFDVIGDVSHGVLNLLGNAGGNVSEDIYTAATQ